MKRWKRYVNRAIVGAVLVLWFVAGAKGEPNRWEEWRSLNPTSGLFPQIVGIQQVPVLDYNGYADSSITNPSTGKGRVYFSTTDNLLHCLTSTGASCMPASGGSGTVTSVSGTTNQINVATGTTTPVISLSSTLIAPGSFAATSLSCGVLNTTTCVITGFGGTSGSATITWPAVAGTTSNPIVFANAISSSSNIQSSASITAGAGNSFIFSGRTRFSAPADSILAVSNNAQTAFQRLDFGVNTTANPALCISGTALSQCLGDGSNGGSWSANAYLTAVNCANGASPAVCTSAASGVVAVPTGTNPTLVVDTTAVTATSRIFVSIDESATISATTCNTSLATLTQPVVTARTAGTSFTIQIGATLVTNPACVSYWIVN